MGAKTAYKSSMFDVGIEPTSTPNKCSQCQRSMRFQAWESEFLAAVFVANHLMLLTHFITSVVRRQGSTKGSKGEPNELQVFGMSEY